MATSRVPASWQYLQEASSPMLQAFELSRLNLAANLRKQLEALISQYLEEAVAAMFARLLLNQQPTSCGPASERAQSAPSTCAARPTFLPYPAPVRAGRAPTPISLSTEISMIPKPNPRIRNIRPSMPLRSTTLRDAP